MPTTKRPGVHPHSALRMQPVLWEELSPFQLSILLVPDWLTTRDFVSLLKTAFASPGLYEASYPHRAQSWQVFAYLLREIQGGLQLPRWLARHPGWGRSANACPTSC